MTLTHRLLGPQVEERAKKVMQDFLRECAKKNDMMLLFQVFFKRVRTIQERVKKCLALDRSRMVTLEKAWQRETSAMLL